MTTKPLLPSERLGVPPTTPDVDMQLAKFENHYRVTRWCCRSGMCIECMAHVTMKGRKRVVQADNLSEEMAKRYLIGWSDYDPKMEPMP